MGWIGESVDSIKSLQFRQVLTQVVILGMIVTLALIIWKGLMCFIGSESPVVVVLSGRTWFQKGDGGIARTSCRWWHSKNLMVAIRCTAAS